MKKNKTGKTCIPFGFIFLAATGILFAFAACTSLQKTTQKIGQDLSGSGDFKKRVLCLPFENKTGIEKEKPHIIFLQNLTDSLQKQCPALIIESSEKGFAYSDFLFKPPLPSGQIDFLKLADAFRRKGYNTLVLGSIMDMSAGVEKRGLLWFKEDRYFFKAHVEIMGIDTRTGTRILDEDFFYEAEVDEKEFELFQSGKGYDSKQLKPALLSISKEAGKTFCEVMDAIPWFCTVEAVEENKVILSCGKKSGLKEGLVLNVFEKGKPVTGIAGQQYLLKGEKVGQIKITDVSMDRSEAIPILKTPVSAGSIVTF